MFQKVPLALEDALKVGKGTSARIAYQYVIIWMILCANLFIFVNFAVKR